MNIYQSYSSDLFFIIFLTIFNVLNIYSYYIYDILTIAFNWWKFILENF